MEPSYFRGMRDHHHNLLFELVTLLRNVTAGSERRLHDEGVWHTKPET